MEKTQDPEATRLSIRRSFPVTPEKVWRAWTDPQALSRWFGTGKLGPVTSAEADLRVGGLYRITFQSAQGESSEVSGVYQEVEPLRRLVFSWAWRSTPDRVSRISIDFQAVAEGTQMHFVHDRFFDRQTRNNYEAGWTDFFVQLVADLQPTVSTEKA